MRLDEHEQRAISEFGKPYREVHLWLDEFAGQPPYGMRHRKKRHHLEGIEEARKLFGDEGAAVARQHIVDDLTDLDGWDERIDPFPANEKEYVAMGLY